MYALEMSSFKTPDQADSIGEFCGLVRSREEMTVREWAEEINEHFTCVNRVENDRVVRPMKYLKKLLPYLKHKCEEERLVQLLTRTLVQELRSPDQPQEVL